MNDSARTAGDKWGRLFGLAVDACKSHHECECDEHDGPPWVVARRPLVPDPIPTIDSITFTTKMTCDEPTWTQHNGQARIPYDPPGTVTFAAPIVMHELPATDQSSTAASEARAAPPAVSASGLVTVTLGNVRNLHRGLYTGYVGPNANSVGPATPILIYVDDVTP